MQNGLSLVDIYVGFEVAPGDDGDIEVANDYPWGSNNLVFSDGAHAGSALTIEKFPTHRGMSRCFRRFLELYLYSSMSMIHMKTGRKFHDANRLRLEGDTVAATGPKFDVLVRTPV